MSTDGPRLRVTLLVVCTGNICRSPAAERLFKANLSPHVTCESAGTHALLGRPIAGPIGSHLNSAHAQSDMFAARQLTEEQIRQADLVLAVTRGHRAAVVELWPGAVRRCFTLREFARLLILVEPKQLPRGDPATRLLAAIPLAAAQRRQVSHRPEVDDIDDPYGRSDERYVAAFNQIQDAVVAISNVIVPTSDRLSELGMAQAVDPLSPER